MILIIFYLQAFIKDDSLSNRVLVAKSINNEKSDSVPLKLYGSNSMPDNVLGSHSIREFWKKLSENNLISKHKLQNLMTDPSNINKYAKKGFVKRQLVETSQVVKLISTILSEKYQNENTKIIEVRAQFTAQMRKMFDFVKLRELNDFHHGFDAYLVNVVGLYLYKRYPKLRSYFVYNDFKKLSDDSLNNLKEFNFLGDIQFSKDKIEYDDQLVMDKQDVLKNLERAYYSKTVPVSKEVYTNENNMFKQTIFPAESAKNKRLIRIKNNKPTDIYGGYTSNNDAYLAIIKEKDNYRVVGVPMRALNTLKKAEKESKAKYLAKLKEVLVFRFKEKKKKNVTQDFDILLEKVPFGQLIIDGDQKFTLGSSEYQHNAKQLSLSKKSIETLSKLDKKDILDEELVDVYVNILNQLDDYYELYGDSRKKLRDRLDLFRTLAVTDKKQVICKLLDALHANSETANLKTVMKIKTPFGQLQRKGGIKLSFDAELIYQSPTGLIERCVKLKDL